MEDNGIKYEASEEKNAQEELGIAMMVLKELNAQNKRLEEAGEKLERANIRLEEANKRQQRSNYCLVGIIVAMFIGFLLFLSQYEFESYVQDGNGYNNINTGEQGDVINGAEAYGSEEEEW